MMYPVSSATTSQETTMTTKTTTRSNPVHAFAARKTIVTANAARLYLCQLAEGCDRLADLAGKAECCEAVIAELAGPKWR